jgi:hypothetical protein
MILEVSSTGDVGLIDVIKTKFSSAQPHPAAWPSMV